MRSTSGNNAVEDAIDPREGEPELLIEKAISDEALLRESLERPERLAEFFDAYHGEIYRYVVSRLSVGHADDLAAEAFLVAFRGRARFTATSGSNVRAWLYGIATNLIRRHHRTEERKCRVLGRAEAAERVIDGYHDDNRIVERDAAHGVQRDLATALRSLKRADRDVLLLVALAGSGIELPEGGDKLTGVHQLIVDPATHLLLSSNYMATSKHTGAEFPAKQSHQVILHVGWSDQPPVVPSIP